MTYNSENRPVRFESEDGSTVVDCTYDYMGRRHTRKVTVNGTVSNYLRYIYRGYLQIAAIDAVSGVFRWFLFWDPTQPTATRPLAIRKDSTWYAYGWDLTKNVTEVFGAAGYIRTTYTYTPYGEATATGDVTQPFTWSSEYADEELGLIYYNYRHLNPHDGRWISRDPIEEQGGWNLYAFVNNNGVNRWDYLGLKNWVCDKKHLRWYDKLSFTLTNTIGGEEYEISDPQSVIIGTFKEKLQDTTKSILERKIDGRQIIESARKIINDNWFTKNLSIIAQNTRSTAYILEKTKLSVKLEYCCCKTDNNGKIKYFMNPVSSVNRINHFINLKIAGRAEINRYTIHLKHLLKETASKLKNKSCKK